MLHVSTRLRRGGFLLDASFDAPEGSVVALFGASGCGKTTLLNIIAGLLRPDAARIECDGEVLCDTARGITLSAERRRIGYVFQDARLFPHLDVRANLIYGLRRCGVAKPRITFDEVVALLGIDGLLGRRPYSLSGGERQRVALGRALLSQPRLLMLDEPLAALDAARRDEVLPYIESLRDRWRLPIIYVTHQFDELIRVATHVVLLENGRVTAADPLTDMATHPELRRVVGADAFGVVTTTAACAAYRSAPANCARRPPDSRRVSVCAFRFWRATSSWPRSVPPVSAYATCCAVWLRS
jgi:molybdate transport system ATP-binding protein